MASSIPPVKPGSTPNLSALEAKALQGLRATAFRFTGQTCVATTSPVQVITLSGVASLRPNLVVDGHENLAGRELEVRFIGSKIYIYLAAFRAADRATVDGQTTYVYQGSFSPTDLTKLGLPGQLGRQTADKLRRLGATREQVTSYINSSAVALRTVSAIYKGSKLLT